jgi:tetratricopeptide (TPR) repeat protein
MQNAEPGAKRAWSQVMTWVGGATALIGLFASLAGGITWFASHHKRGAELQTQMVLAQTQAKQGEYQAAVQTYAEILKSDALFRPALDQQLNTTMLWVEDFHVAVQEGENPAQLAGPELDQIMAILDAGLARNSGTQAADVQAHIGWAHWLNQRIAEREFGPAAEQHLRAALNSDPSNVYANGMLGNWMLQNGGSFTEAIQHLNLAVSTGKARPFVRALQLGGLMHLDDKGVRTELMKAANDMRKSNEVVDEHDRTRILTRCFDPIVTDHGELQECLSAVPPDEAWKTYLWLDNKPEDRQDDVLVHEFVEANLLEISGKQQESLEKYRLLHEELKNGSGTMKNSVDAAIARLTHS